MPRPVLPRDRSYLDKLVEYLVGDGPSNRYALICKNCESHNGMALKEEFEYFGMKFILVCTDIFLVLCANSHMRTYNMRTYIIWDKNLEIFW
jgi:hypothetical protein